MKNFLTDYDSSLRAKNKIINNVHYTVCENKPCISVKDCLDDCAMAIGDICEEFLQGSVVQECILIGERACGKYIEPSE